MDSKIDFTGSHCYFLKTLRTLVASGEILLYKKDKSLVTIILISKET
jgi:hypothetical protein